MVAATYFMAEFRRFISHTRQVHPVTNMNSRLPYLAIAVFALSALRAEAAVTANVVANTLTVNGDALDNQITVSVAAGDATRIEVKSGAIVVGSFLRATFNAITVGGGDGNDRISMLTANGPFTEPATLSGVAGNDVIVGGNLNVTINGVKGNDDLSGVPGNDTVNGGDGNDEMRWLPGDGNVILNGG